MCIKTQYTRFEYLFRLNYVLDIIVEYSFVYLYTFLKNFTYPYLRKPVESHA